MKPILFLDMDMVLVNFNSSKNIPLDEKHIYNHFAIYKKGFFIDLLPMEGAVDFVKTLLKGDYWDIHILTQPVSGNPYSYGEKAAWIIKYLPELTDKITMTQNKLMLKGQILIDDNIRWKDFDGVFILFNPLNPKKEFEYILDKLKYICR